jgi:nicotinate-nucleotide pyrophosphorylase (carboxylating)
MPLDPAAYRDLVRRALAEDLGRGDITSEAIVPDDLRATAALVAKSECVVAGLDVVQEVFRQADSRVTFAAVVADGTRLRPGDRLATVDGPARAMLAAERTALNVLQHLSGIATLTRRFVDAAAGRVTILDTRKTLPGLRALAKYAVRCGGGVNHRVGLYDAILIKENHARIAGGIEAAVARVRARWPSQPIEVEAQSLAEVDDALAARAEIIMLDNLSEAEMRGAVARIDGRARIEISGGVTLDRLPALAALGANAISVGALTHSAPAADISLEFEPLAPVSGVSSHGAITA